MSQTKHTPGIKKALNIVYKACQCADDNDISIAMNECFQLRSIYGKDSKAIMRRIISLKKRSETLEMKSL